MAFQQPVEYIFLKCGPRDVLDPNHGQEGTCSQFGNSGTILLLRTLVLRRQAPGQGITADAVSESSPALCCSILEATGTKTQDCLSPWSQVSVTWEPMPAEPPPFQEGWHRKLHANFASRADFYILIWPGNVLSSVTCFRNQSWELVLTRKFFLPRV